MGKPRNPLFFFGGSLAKNPTGLPGMKFRKDFCSPLCWVHPCTRPAWYRKATTSLENGWIKNGDFTSKMFQSPRIWESSSIIQIETTKWIPGCFFGVFREISQLQPFAALVWDLEKKKSTADCRPCRSVKMIGRMRSGIGSLRRIGKKKEKQDARIVDFGYLLVN